MKYNRICQILGIEKPVIQGPLSWLTDAILQLFTAILIRHLKIHV